MKRYLSMLLVLCMLFSVLPGGAYAVQQSQPAQNTPRQTSEGGSDSGSVWEYSAYAGGIQLTAYNGTQTDVYVPAQVDEKPVVKLGDSLFENNDALNSVTLAEGITEIGNKAFYDADNLVCIVTNETLTTIGAEAFYSCDVFNSIIIYDGVKSIGQNAFAQCPAVVVWCNDRSTAFAHVIANGIPYELMNADAPTETIQLDGFTYYLVNGEASVVEYNGDSTDVVIPSAVNGCIVTQLHESFRAWDAQHLTIPGSVKFINDCAFNGWDNLVSVTFQEGVEELGHDVFYTCGSLKSITFPGSITTIGSMAVAECWALTEVIFGDGVKTIGNSAFQFCDKLKDIHIPASITNIEESAFIGCSSVAGFWVDEKNPAYCNDEHGVLYSKDKTTLVAMPSGFSGTYTVPEGVTDIAPWAFAFCDGLTGLTFPDSIVNVGEYVVFECPNLVCNVYEGAKYIGQRSNPYFVLLEVENNALSSCTIHPDTEIVAEFATIDCDDLEYIIIPPSLRVFPSDTITKAALLYVDDGNPYFSSDSQGVLFNKDKTVLIRVPTGISGKYTVPDSVTRIEESAFSGCSSLKSVVIPDSVTEVGTYAFASCTSLTKVVIGKGIINMGESIFSSCRNLSNVVIADGASLLGPIMFGGCFNLNSITIPASVTTISANAFSGCRRLADVYYRGSKHQWDQIAIDPENLVLTDAFLHFKEESPDDAQSPSNNITWSINDEGVLTVSGSGRMPDYSTSDQAPWYSKRREITSAVIGNGITHIGSYAFYDCCNLTDISISESVTRIGKGVFTSCTSLKSVSIPAGVAQISSNLFEGCESLAGIWVDENNEAYISDEQGVLFNKSKTTLIAAPSNISGAYSIPDSVTAIGNYAFRSCSKLAAVTIPESVISIGYYAFNGCSSLKNITIPNAVTSIEQYAFADCSSLESIIIPDSVTSLGICAFAGCQKMTCAIIGKGISTIERSLFSGCVQLSKASISNSVTKIESRAFSGCEKLVYLFIPKEVTSISDNIFSFATKTIFLVEEGTFAHTYAMENRFLYAIARKTTNPEISFGTNISGMVTYTDGSAAIGITADMLYDDGTVKARGITGIDGTYTFPYAEAGAYTIRVTDAAGNTAATKVSVKRINAFDVFVSGDTSLTLKKGYTISGTVNADGANLTITDLAGNVIAGAVADENGLFCVANVPNGTYIITAKAENGSVSQEITVFDENLSGITLTIAPESATVWGYVKVEDRQGTQSLRNWVQVSLYNAEGVIVAQARSDADGKYQFSNLPLGTYSLVAETAEMRPDKAHGYDRSHTLTGYSFIGVTAAATYQAEDLVLREVNETRTTISGKVTAQGENQACQVVLVNAFLQEVAQYNTGKNGKYTFANILDGMYIITATTQSKGMGFAVVTIQNGEVFGETDIQVAKTNKISEREAQFNADLAACLDKESASQLRDRIAEEKQFYDSLSEKEKKQLSAAYVEHLNQLVEWAANCQVTTNDDTVTVDQAGLVVSSQELENKQTVTFNIEVHKVEAYTPGSDGIESEEDYIYHELQDKATDKEISQYYEITMSKTVDGVEVPITSVYKDTDTTGKFRITMEIPEEYRGHKHYSFLHVHCGEVVELTDLDDDPNTVTFEVDKFSTFALTYTDVELTQPDNGENISISSVSLRPGKAGIYFNGQFNLDQSLPVERYGVAVSVYNQLPVADNSDHASLWTQGAYSVLISNIFGTEKTAAQNSANGETKIYARAYILLEDGTYIYSDAVAVTLHQIVEAIDADWDSLSASQKEAVGAMYSAYGTVMNSWAIENIKNYAA